MSLRMLLDPTNAATITTAWPDKPSQHRLPDASPLAQMISPAVLNGYLDTGCVPATHLKVVKEGVALDPTQYVRHGRILPARLRRVREGAGCTLHLRHLELWHPPAGALVAALQQETGCTGYLSAFITPPRSQGLLWHWDQALGFIVQLAGTKRWELWAPMVEAPMLDHLSSVTPGVWNPAWVKQWKDKGPDLTVDLNPGDVLVLPRGWVHNPHSLESDTESIHLTLVLRERTPLWVAEQLVAAAIADPRFRAAIPPARFAGDGLTDTVRETARLLAGHLATVDPAATAATLREIAEAEPDPDA